MIKNPGKIKTYSDCYLYSKYPKYNTMIFKAIMTDNFIDKASPEFNENILVDIKRAKVNSHIVQILVSPKTILYFPENPLPTFFKVLVCNDPKAPKNKQSKKLFIDCNGIIRGNRTNTEALLSYLIAGFCNMLYATGNTFSSGTITLESLNFAKLFTYVIDYIAKISVSEANRDKCMYLASRYYLEGIACRDSNFSRNIAKSNANITDIKENTYQFMIKDDDAFTNLKSFVKLIRDVFKIENLTVDIVVEKWMYLFNPSAVFGLEYQPAFQSMMTHAYIGAYINNQKTIEKICGKTMIEYSKLIIDQI